MTKRDTINYVMKDGRKIVQHGITNQDLCERTRQHEADGKKFTHLCKVGKVKSRESALKAEDKYIKDYQRQHGGRPPKYNKNKIY